MTAQDLGQSRGSTTTRSGGRDHRGPEGRTARRRSVPSRPVIVIRSPSRTSSRGFARVAVRLRPRSRTTCCPSSFPAAIPPRAIHQLVGRTACAAGVLADPHAVFERLADVGVARPLRPPAAFSSHAGSCGPCRTQPLVSILPGWALVPDPKEVYVDVGACTGDTLADFLTWTEGEFERYYAYEPDPDNLTELRRSVDLLRDPRVRRQAVRSGRPPGHSPVRRRSGR